MNRLEFMQRLEQLLSDISPKEREEALQYYNDYLNDAGVENEQEVLDSLGSPEKVAKIIKEGLGDGGIGGEFTENGFRDCVTAGEKKNEVEAAHGKDSGSNANGYAGYTGGYQGSPWQGYDQEKEEEKGGKKLSGGMIALIVIGCILASPLLISIAGVIIGAVFGLLGGILGIVMGIIAGGIGFLIAAVILIGIGIGQLFSTPVIGLCLLGVGLLMGGFATLLVWLSVWLCGTAAPWLIRNIVAVCGRLFHKKGEERL